MNSKLLFAVTVAISVLSVGTLALAADARAVREDRAEWIGPDASRAFDPVGAQVLPNSSLSRADVKADARRQPG